MSERLYELKISDVDLTDIDLADDRYRISHSQTNTALLAQSILEIGLVNPVVLLLVHDKHIIISGFNRVKAHLLNKALTITARVINPETSKQKAIGSGAIKSETIYIDYLVLAIGAACFKHQLSQVELIKSLIKLSVFMDAGHIAHKSGTLFNTQLNQKYIDELIAIGQLQPQGLALLESGHLSIKAAKKLSVLNGPDVLVFLMLLGAVKASTSVQLEMILYLTEISKRDKLSLKSVIQSSEIETIIDDENIDLITKTQQVRDCIYQLRFPELFKARQDVKQKINSLGLGRAVKIEPPPNFEAQQFTFSFTAKTYKQFVRHFNKLTTAVQDLKLKDIFSA
ncbi:MAG: ParB N-terminal domain-containing protein [Desulfobacula sp.]|nr:ParB N-terminal domain-containing protein [Desulfobacula sp.]